MHARDSSWMPMEKLVSDWPSLSNARLNPFHIVFQRRETLPHADHVALLGGNFKVYPDLGQGQEPIALPGTFHLVANMTDQRKILLDNRLPDTRHIQPAILQVGGNDLGNIRIDQDRDRFEHG